MVARRIANGVRNAYDTLTVLIDYALEGTRVTIFSRFSIRSLRYERKRPVKRLDTRRLIGVGGYVVYDIFSGMSAHLHIYLAEYTYQFIATTTRRR